MIVNVPIESLESRYSTQWTTWFETEFSDRGYSYVTVNPKPLRLDIKDGGFLDVVGTNYYKARQIVSITELVDSGHIPRNERVVFLIHDGWFPVEQLAYMRDMLGCYDWRFIGIFHDGTYDKWDLTAKHNMYGWGEDLENSWFKIYDAVVVGSQFHANTIMEERRILPSKLHVIPWHVEIPEGTFGCSPFEKKNIVVFPHRLDPDKQPEMFDRLIKDFQYHAGSSSAELLSWRFIRTRDMNLDKAAYYRLLSEAKIVVSCALLEMFGIAMVEAALLGCIPLVPDRLSYREIFPEQFRYSGYDDLKFKLQRSMTIKPLVKIPLQEKLLTRLHNRTFFDDLFTLMEAL